MFLYLHIGGSLNRTGNSITFNPTIFFKQKLDFDYKHFIDIL